MPMLATLIQDQHITIPVSLAATLGLEEAVMLQIMVDCCRHRQSTSSGGYDWIELPSAEAALLMPFWTEQDIDRISRALQQQGIIRLDSSSLMLSRQLVFALNESEAEPGQQQPTGQPGAKPAPKPATHAQSLRGKTPLDENWQPSDKLLHKLSEFHGISSEFARALVPEFVLYWRDRRSSTYSWESRFMKHALREWQKNPPARQMPGLEITGKPETAMHEYWQPDRDALQILVRSGIEQQFIEEAVPEFILYWRDRGDVTNTWDSRFIAHIRRQWSRYQSSLQFDTTPRRITSDWQPSEDVFDILLLANIDIDFARQTVAEFVVYWRDTNQVYNAWNARFLQHVKSRWARRHQLYTAGSGHDQKTQSATEPDRRGIIEKHTDKTWREGLL